MLQVGVFCHNCGSVCRHFKLILRRNLDVLSSDFEAVVISEENGKRNIDIETEFYHGFEECKFFIFLRLFLQLILLASSSVPTWIKLRNNPGQVVHTCVPLSPSSITWYWSKDDDFFRLGM